MKLGVLACALTVVLCPIGASADPISVIYSSRGVLANAQLEYPSGPRDVHFAYQGDDLSALAQQFTPVGHAEASASLQSSIADPTHLFGSALATASLDAPTRGDATGAAYYFVGLRLEQPYAFTFDGQFDGTGANSGSLWQLQLYRSGSDPVLINQNGSDAGRVTQTGALLPGNWYLYVAGSAMDSTASRLQYNFTLDLLPLTPPSAPTPEPATVLLLGSGVAGAFAARRRH